MIESTWFDPEPNRKQWSFCAHYGTALLRRAAGSLAPGGRGRAGVKHV
ncbi:MAG: hypothetical protein KF715_10735 [Candidatus Didemnitutus sp.]|nr:hypothetical protein [Candidatus Didemnitutus sp.]